MTAPVSDRPIVTSTMHALGEIQKTHLPKDAIHLATFTARCRQSTTRAGTPVGLHNGVISPFIVPHVGIVDPFLKTPARAGDIVIVVLYPKTVSEVRHTWDDENIDKEIRND